MVDKGIDFDFDDSQIEKKTKKPKKIVEDRGISTEPIKEDKKISTEPIKEDKGTSTDDFEFYMKETFQDIKKDIEKLEESGKSKKEKDKQIQKLIKEEKKKMDKILKDQGTSTDEIKEVKEKFDDTIDKIIDDMIDKIEKEAKETKETKETSTDNETNIMQALNDGYKPKGNVSNKDYIHEMYQAENKFKHIIEKLKPHGDIERSNLNKESNEYFYQEIMPLLQKFNIDKEKLYNLFNKKPNHNLQYRNLTTLNNAIKKFLNEKLESLEKLDK